MRFRGRIRLVLGVLCVAALRRCRLRARVSAQRRGGMFLGSTEDVAIKYGTAPLDNPVIAVNQKLKDGTLRLTLDGRGGYLQSALQALDIPVESQMLVFSATSLQARLIRPDNPRALFFNDRVVLGYVRNGEILEVAAQDATEGIVFYTLEQKAGDAPQFQRVTSVPRLSSECRHAGRAGSADVQHDAGVRHPAVQVGRDGSPDAAQGPLGRLVRHGKQRRGRAHRQRGACARRPREPRARLGGRTLRSGRLPRHDERHRRADGVLAPDVHDQPDHARGMGSARRGSEAAPAVCGRARRGRPRRPRHERRRERGRRLHAVHRRNEADGPRPRARPASPNGSRPRARRTRRAVRCTSSISTAV